MQAVDLIDDKMNMTAKTNLKSMGKPVMEEVSVQVGELIDDEKK